MPNPSAASTRPEPAPGGYFHRFCCCPWGADLLWAGLAATLLLGVLVVAGNQLLAVSDDLGLMDFVTGGDLAAPRAAESSHSGPARSADGRDQFAEW